MKNKASTILAHVTGCLVFLLLPVLFSPGPQTFSETLQNWHTRRDLLIGALFLGIFYLNLQVLIPRFYFRKRYVVFVLLQVICLLAAIFIASKLVPNEFAVMRKAMPPGGRFMPGKMMRNREMMRGFGPRRNDSSWQSLLFEMYHHLFLYLVMLFFAMTIRINRQWEKARQEKLSAELSYLKAQINPHFLFNTLNSIYALAIDKSDQTANAVIKLSEMMRYVLNEADKDKVPLDKELAYIRDYIELQETRFAGSVPISFVISGDTDNRVIAPLILIPFVENAFKHGVNAEENSDIKIDIAITDNSLQMVVINNKVTIARNREEHSGLGIENTKNRLELIYPGSHVLKISDEKDRFIVSLILLLA
ncbi:sensor histidine kinase [Sediminibacterium ginsengisoli]|uniref:Histidine kinase n=1 Tax=Sediminibacterium ginsengisoli TaxID=413434 RepID=A0A1T4KYT5_9BACT|nr:histidine kinase [Sediminibacterium ginsengisoli]SJZ47589.1 Histidine kinase [Sediminibacterium ginsengisoli]